MKNICYLNLATYSQVGGIENYNKSFLKALDSLNERVTSISVYDKDNNQEFENVEFKNFNKNKVRASFYLLKNVFKIEKLIVAHINLLPVVMIAKILNPKLRVYLSIYGIEVWKKIPFLFAWFLKRIQILSISKYTTKIFSKFNELSENSISYLPPSVDGMINKSILKNVYDKNNFNILSVTRLSSNDSYKGVDSIIKVIPLLLEKIPNIKYTIIGKGCDKARLVALVKKLNIEKYIEFKGFVGCVDSYYQYCDIFALPSKGEGFGIVYIEAMKYKKPCIACDEGGQTDAVIDGQTGYLCEYDNLKCISEKIITLFDNKRLLKLFGENAYQYFMINFSFKEFKNRLNGILNG
jgi:phosphatidyl-myo-inositol dimannoside synthase